VKPTNGGISENEERVTALFATIKLLPERQRDWAVILVLCLMDDKWPRWLVEDKDDPIQMARRNYVGLVIPDKISSRKLSEIKTKSREVYDALFRWSSDKDIKPNMKTDILKIIFKWFPMWRIWWLEDMPQKTGPNMARRDMILFWLMEAYLNVPGNNKQCWAFDQVAKIMTCIGVRKGTTIDNLRRIYGKQLKRLQETQRHIDHKTSIYGRSTSAPK
jgi:hypothetical protein